jgi:hypothetical protein
LTGRLQRLAVRATPGNNDKDTYCADPSQDLL